MQSPVHVAKVGLILLELGAHEQDGGNRLLGELKVWVAIAAECQCAIRVDIEGILRDPPHLASQVITHAISGARNVWECHGRVTECHGLTCALDTLIGHLHINLEVAGSCTLEVTGDVNNERHATFILS
jgi:hypothetical protein